jgi:hypothetical protein
MVPLVQNGEAGGLDRAAVGADRDDEGKLEAPAAVLRRRRQAASDQSARKK